MSNPGNVAGGHKANLSNPNTSEESKQHSREVLDSQLNGGDVGASSSSSSASASSASSASSGSSGDKNPNNVAGGYKATLKNPNVSDEAKANAQEQLDNMGAK